MTIVDTITNISDWLNDNVCPEIKFKTPPDKDKPIDDNYAYEEINPYAFPLYVPTKDKMPPGVISAYPSICVRITDGSDNLNDLSRGVTINLCFSCWNPGVHGQDIIYPKGQNPETLDKYKSGYGGWMDVWNFVDLTLRKLESFSNINGLKIEPDIRFGPLKEQNAIPDYYPHWYAYIEFTAKSINIRNNKDLEEFL